MNVPAEITVEGWCDKRREFRLLKIEVDAPVFLDDSKMIHGLGKISYSAQEQLRAWLTSNMQELVVDTCRERSFSPDLKNVSIRYKQAPALAAETLSALAELTEEEGLAFCACYLRMRELLEGFPEDIKVKLVFAALDIALDAREQAFKEAQELVNKLEHG